MQYIIHFQTVDPILFAVLQKVGEIKIAKVSNYFERLCDAIISQQLSTKAADTIFARFKALFPDEHIIPVFLLAIPQDLLREIGISYQKISYIRDLAQKIVDETICLEDLEKNNDEAVIRELIKVKGIGRWTAEMFLIFSLGREDIFSYGDLGLRRAIQKLYGFANEPTLKQMEEKTKIWAPYRSYASIALWRSLTLK